VLKGSCSPSVIPIRPLDGVKTFIDSLPVNKAEKEAIAFRNAERLLGITV
jgi:conserved domain protein